jgi:hypothetical protein
MSFFIAIVILLEKDEYKSPKDFPVRLLEMHSTFIRVTVINQTPVFTFSFKP